MLLGLDELPEEPEPLADGVLELELDPEPAVLGVEELDELDGDELPEVPSVVELLDDLPAVDGVAVLEPLVPAGAVVLLLLELRAGGVLLELLLPLSPQAASASVPRIAVAIRNLLVMQIGSLRMEDSVKASARIVASDAFHDSKTRDIGHNSQGTLEKKDCARRCERYGLSGQRSARLGSATVRLL